MTLYTELLSQIPFCCVPPLLLIYFPNLLMLVDLVQYLWFVYHFDNLPKHIPFGVVMLVCIYFPIFLMFMDLVQYLWFVITEPYKGLYTLLFVALPITVKAAFFNVQPVCYQTTF